MWNGNQNNPLHFCVTSLELHANFEIKPFNPKCQISYKEQYEEPIIRHFWFWFVFGETGILMCYW